MTRIFTIIILSIISIGLFAEVTYQPYIQAFSSDKSINEVRGEVKSALTNNHFVIVGEYRPASDNNRWLIVVNHPNLTKSVKAVGGLTGFASTLRVALTVESGKVVVSYTSPEYWCRAYFREDFNKVSGEVLKVNSDFTTAFSDFNNFVGKGFGSEDGLDADDLEDYNYMLGMPKFDDTEELAEFQSYEEAIQTIDNNLKKKSSNLKEVYKYSVPGKELTVYGIGLSGEKGEEHFMPIIDISNPKHTAFLPYEILVMGDEVHMLHGRFRIALSFPDLTMGTFTKIMSTPGNIEDMMKLLVVKPVQ